MNRPAPENSPPSPTSNQTDLLRGTASPAPVVNSQEQQQTTEGVSTQTGDGFNVRPQGAEINNSVPTTSAAQGQYLTPPVASISTLGNVVIPPPPMMGHLTANHVAGVNTMLGRPGNPPYPGMGGTPPISSPPTAAHMSPTQAPHMFPPTNGEAAAANVTSPVVYRQVKFENALDFLDQVKLQFARQPRVYNQFLDIMKDFKTQSIDTPGVIMRVSDLFKGHKNLIQGFNTFLPPGFKIEVRPETPPPAPQQAQAQQQRARAQPPPQPSQAAPRKQPEFDHARNYVKKIKMRFHNQPHIYKNFLEILHTYHKEQHTIKDVYDQVAVLFQNHSDLMEEFTQFLPDPIPANMPQIPGGGGRAAKAQRPRKQTAKLTSERVTNPVNDVATDRRLKRTRQKDEPSKIESQEKTLTINGSPEEIAFFTKVKAKLSTKRYNEFLKTLNLYNQEIIGRVELCVLVRELLGRHNDLFDKFKHLVNVSDYALAEFSDSDKNKPKISPAWTEIDFTACKRLGPSYRALPKHLSNLTCHGRTPLCWEVLNDNWVSVATGTEDFTFKSSRKNQFEEILFKCEDDRYELDLVIELNSSTIRALEPILKRINDLKEEEKASFTLRGVELDPVLHLRSIERIYGERGHEVIEGLYANPVAGVPIIMNRLKQKDGEWKRARREWNKIWREVNEKNYWKALDHQTYHFKHVEKKILSPKGVVMLAEIKQKYQDHLKDRASTRHLTYEFSDKNVFEDIAELIVNTTDKLMSKVDKEKLDGFLYRFLPSFFKAEIMGEGPARVRPVKPSIYPFTDTTMARSRAQRAANTTTNGPAPYAATAAVAAAVASSSGESNNVVAKPAAVQVKVEDAKTAAKPAENSSADASAATATDADVSSPAGASGDKKLRLFFGNTALYIFFRFYQLIYERMALASELAKKSPEEFVPPLTKVTGNAEEKKQDKYKYFIKLLSAFVNQGVDQTKFEDEIREIFGINAHSIYNIDKLVLALAKQVQAVLLDDACQKLLQLYSYEDRREGFIEGQYWSNVLEYMGEERCFRFEFEGLPSGADFHITLMDSSSQPRFMELTFTKDKWEKYVDSYLQGQSSTAIRKSGVFLLRNQKKNVTRSTMEGVEMVNGLECKICMTTFKMFYVEDTEDYFHRRRPTNEKKAVLIEAANKKHLAVWHGVAAKVTEAT